MGVRIATGHVLDVLRELPAESVHVVVTSPPYYSLRDYKIELQMWGGDAGHDHCFETEVVEGEIRTGLGMAALGARYRGGGHIRAERGFCACGAWRGSLGLEPTLALYLDHMIEIFREVRRVMRADATCWLNIGDSYNNVGGGNAFNAPKPKDLMLIPSRLAIRLQEDGWRVRSDIIWAKRAPMPESCTDRPTSAHEHVLLLTKSGAPTFWTHRDHTGSRTKPKPDYRWVDHDNDDAETDVEPEGWRIEPAAGGVGKRWSRINLWDGHDYYYDAEAVKEESVSDHDSGNGFDGRQGTADYQVKSGGVGTKEEWKRGGKRNLRNIWLLGPSPFPEAHFATFHPRIPEIAILAGTSAKGVCPKCGAGRVRVVTTERAKDPTRHTGRAAVGCDDRNDAASSRMISETKTLGWRPSCGCAAGAPAPATVLDPFLGSGTTALVADRLGRDSIGIELNPSYAEMARRRLRDDAGMFLDLAAE